LSCSGDGFHTLLINTRPLPHGAHGELDGYVFEMYHKARFMLLTGEVIRTVGGGFRNQTEIVDGTELIHRLFIPSENGEYDLHYRGGTSTLEIKEILQQIRANERDSGRLFFQRYWSTPNDVEDRSRIDWYLACVIARHCKSDMAKVEAVMRSSKRLQAKWDERGGYYLRRTISIVCQKVEQGDIGH
jgi:primase-polymerase (primpol)-like protein